MLNKHIFNKNFNLNIINDSINSFQKVLSLYDKALPIILSVTPLVNNIKSTLSVVKAIRKINNDKMFGVGFDSLPDYDEKETNQSQDLLNNKKVENPYYPWYTKCRWEKWMWE